MLLWTDFVLAVHRPPPVNEFTTVITKELVHITKISANDVFVHLQLSTYTPVQIHTVHRHCMVAVLYTLGDYKSIHTHCVTVHMVVNCVQMEARLFTPWCSQIYASVLT